MPRVIHTAQALVDAVMEVPALPTRGGNVMATSYRRYAGGAVTILLAAARSGASCVHAGAVGTGPNGDLVRAALAAEGERGGVAAARDRAGRRRARLVAPVAPADDRWSLGTPPVASRRS